MLVLLPPSEGKTAPPTGDPVDLAGLWGRRLTARRRSVLVALVRVSRQRDALAVLGVGASLSGDVARNVRLRREPAAPAREVYTGVLYAAAGLDSLPDDDARARAEAWVRTVSALWGAVGPADRIPAYRLSMGTELPGVGPLAAAWRAPLAAELDAWAGRDLVVDCRSAPYAAAWRVPVGGPGHVTVSVVREVAGRRSVVSHSAKHTRGVLTRHLVTRDGVEPRTPEDLRSAAGELVGEGVVDVELAPGPRSSHVLTLVVP